MKEVHNYKRLLIPSSWRQRLSKANNLSEVADLFNEAEKYSDFDCCAELKEWCKAHSAKMAGIDKPIYVFAETETERLIFSEPSRKWFCKEKDS